jgi:hypothetical protein
MMTTQIPFIGSYSIGQTPQWDGLMTPAGFLLRWFVDPTREFPQQGFVVWQTQLQNRRFFAQTPLTYIYYLGPVILLEILDPSGALSSTASQGGLQNFCIATSPGQNVAFSFPNIAMGVIIASAQTADGTTALQVSGSLNGKTKVTGSLITGQNLDWSSYVLDAVTFTGSGYISVVGMWPLDVQRVVRPTRFCLPVTDHAYPCAQLAATGGRTGLQIAMSRLPALMGRLELLKYEAIYNEMAQTLHRIATGAAMQPLPPDASPNSPTFNADEGSMVQLALLDPHVAEMLGLMCVVQPQNEPDSNQPTCQAFVIDATYLDPQQFHFPASPLTFRADFKATGLNWNGPANVSYDGSVSNSFGLSQPFALNLSPNGQTNLRMALKLTVPLTFQTLDSTGAVINAWSTIPATQTARIGGSNVATLQFAAGSAFVIEEIAWDNLNVEQGVCAVDAVDYGAPSAPGWTRARVRAASGVTGLMQAALDWEVFGDPAVGIDPTDPAFYLVVRGELSQDPKVPKPAATTPPTVPVTGLPTLPVTVTGLSNGSFIIVPPALYGVEPRTLLIDLGDNNQGLKNGWQGYWVRSVDIFGRCSNYGPPAVVQVVDDSLPPPPIIVAAEYIQANQPPTAVLFSRSVAAKKWLADNPTIDGLSASIGWTPETALACPDVDGFSLSFQLDDPSANPAWSVSPYTQILLDSPTNPVTLQGTLSSWATADSSTFQPTVTNVTSPGTSLQIPGEAAPPVLAVCETNLSLDAGTGIFAGWTLVAANGASLPVVTNGNGPNLTITVQCPNTTPPAAGDYSLSPPTSGPGQSILVIETSIASAAVDPADDQRWRSGGLLLLDNTTSATASPYRLVVIGSDGGTFWCAAAGSVLPQQVSDIPPAGTNLTWYPVYTVNVAGAPFGMAPSPQKPRTAGQVVARSLRQSGSIHSAPGVPTTVTAIDATVPGSPTLVGIQTAIDDYCAQLAAPADWHGSSAFPASPGAPGLTWQPVAGMQYNVFRAFDHAIWFVDLAVNRAVHDIAQMSTPTLTALQAPSEAARLAAVQADFQALDNALAPQEGLKMLPEFKYATG